VAGLGEPPRDLRLRDADGGTGRAAAAPSLPGIWQGRRGVRDDSLPGLRPDILRVPFHLAVWLRADSSYVAEPPWRYAFESWRGRTDVFTVQSQWAYGTARFGRARYEWHHYHPDAARARLAEATRFDPHIRPEQVAPQPLGLEAKMLEGARLFRDLDAEAERTAVHTRPPPDRPAVAPAVSYPRRPRTER